MTNKQFCYWLQGYFEILNVIALNSDQYKIIDRSLSQITEDLGMYTSWLRKVVDEVIRSQFDTAVMALFNLIIKSELNLIFEHVIDNSYESDEHTKESLQGIHDGDNHDQ